MYGYLEVLSSQVEAEEDPGEVEETRPVPATLFDQSLINDKRVHYIQAVANRTRDRFIIDVTNGISWLRGESIVIRDETAIITVTVEVALGMSHIICYLFQHMYNNTQLKHLLLTVALLL